MPHQQVTDRTRLWGGDGRSPAEFDKQALEAVAIIAKPNTIRAE